MAINEALAFVSHDTTNRPVPLHLRNAPTKLMDEAGYGKGYKYAHDFGELRRAGVPARLHRRKTVLPSQHAERIGGEDRRAYPHAVGRQIFEIARPQRCGAGVSPDLLRKSN